MQLRLAKGNPAIILRMPKPFLSAEWRNLLMANYPIDASVVKPFLPCRTELDSFEGIHYVSLVGFLFANTKVLGLSVPFHTTFEEVNLRFYVRYKEGGQWKRGVVFLKEIVPRRMITFVANTLYGENYVTMPMKHRWTTDNQNLSVAYYWKLDGEWNYMKAVAEKEPQEIVVGSAEEFITEHYWGYTHINEACSGTYEVRHPKWKVHRVNQFDVFCRAEVLYGPAFAGVLSQKPASVFLATGSPVSVMKGAKIFADKTEKLDSSL